MPFIPTQASHNTPRPRCPPRRKLQQRLLLHVLGGSASKGVESVSMERCHALMQDRGGSHLMEVRLACCARLCCGAICRSFVSLPTV